MHGLMELWYDSAMLAVEAQQVIGLRLMKIATGGATARAESSLMVAEKISEAFGATSMLIRGKSSHAVLKKVRVRVRSNRRRLSR